MKIKLRTLKRCTVRPVSHNKFKRISNSSSQSQDSTEREFELIRVGEGRQTSERKEKTKAEISENSLRKKVRKKAGSRDLENDRTYQTSLQIIIHSNCDKTGS